MQKEKQVPFLCRAAIAKRLAIAVLFLFILSAFLFPFSSTLLGSEMERITSCKLPPPTSQNKGQKMIILHSADLLTYDEELMPNVQKLIGHVALQHDSWYMYCDSAYLNEIDNSFEAFGDIRIVEGDSITITARYLIYEGQKRLATLHENVQLSSGETTLTTEYLFYDRNKGIAYYNDGGVIADSLNFLSSIYAEHEPATGNTYFEQDVELTNPDFILTTQQLQYNTKNKVAYIVAPTTINSDSTVVKTTRGTYNTDLDFGTLLDRSLIIDNQGTLTGDSILYDKRAQVGHAYGNVIMDNKKEKILFRSHYGYTDRTFNYTFATKHAYVTDYSRTDSLYIAADTIEGIDRPSEIPGEENLKYLRGYHNVRLYRKDLQATGDSLNYFSPDSMMTLYGNPILWQDSVQIKADTLFAYFSRDTLQYCYGWTNASSMQQINNENWNKAKGDSLIAYFSDNNIYRILYKGNTESVYYLSQDDLDRYYAISKIKSPSMDVYIAADTISRIYWGGKTEGTLFPIEQVTEAESSLPGVSWEAEKRPMSVADIFVEPKEEPLDTLQQLGTKDEKATLFFDGLNAWQRIEPVFSALVKKRQAEERLTSNKKTSPKASVPDILRRDYRSSSFSDQNTWSPIKLLPLLFQKLLRNHSRYGYIIQT